MFGRKARLHNRLSDRKITVLHSAASSNMTVLLFYITLQCRSLWPDAGHTTPGKSKMKYNLKIQDTLKKTAT
jgi:hypothetical protein